MDLEMGLLIWMINLVSAFEGTHGKKRVVICYELMLENPLRELERIRTALDICTTINVEEANCYANEFLDKKLIHYHFSDDELKTHSAMAISPLCLTIYELVLKLAKDEIAFNSEDFQSAWQSIKSEFSTLYPIYNYTHHLWRQNKEFKRNIRSIHRSFSYKMLYPIRLIDTVFRKVRSQLKSYIVGNVA